MSFEHLGYGWREANLDIGGKGWGVFAYSSGWPKEYGTEVNRLGELPRLVAAEGCLVFVRAHGNGRVLGRSTPERASRQGSFFLHLVDLSPVGQVDGAIFELISAGYPFSSPDEFSDPLPTQNARPIELQLSRSTTGTGRGETDGSTTLVLASHLAYADGVFDTITYRGRSVDELADLISSALRLIPEPLQNVSNIRAWTPSGGSPADAFVSLSRQSDPSDDTSASALVLDADVGGGMRCRADNLPDTYLARAGEIIEYARIDGLQIPRCGSVGQLFDFLDVRRLYNVEPARLTDDEVRKLVSVEGEAGQWLSSRSAIDRAVMLGLTDGRVAQTVRSHSRVSDRADLVELVSAAIYDRLDDASQAVPRLEAFGVPWSEFSTWMTTRLQLELLNGRGDGAWLQYFAGDLIESLDPGRHGAEDAIRVLAREVDDFAVRVRKSANRPLQHLVAAKALIGEMGPAGDDLVDAALDKAAPIEIAAFVRHAEASGAGPEALATVFKKTSPRFGAVSAEAVTTACGVLMDEGWDPHAVLATLVASGLTTEEIRVVLATTWPQVAERIGLHRTIRDLTTPRLSALGPGYEKNSKRSPEGRGRRGGVTPARAERPASAREGRDVAERRGPLARMAEYFGFGGQHGQLGPTPDQDQALPRRRRGDKGTPGSVGGWAEHRGQG
ncbi:hypothetical protein [Dietzia sp. 2505]|uniref:hypothetical protein n=1 Tax=Dietzia sp. 2505 TaxID=3156457 RepID=UPI003390D3DD